MKKRIVQASVAVLSLGAIVLLVQSLRPSWLAGVAWPWLVRPGSVRPGSWVEVEQKQRAQLATHLDSPIGKAWLAKDFRDLESRFGSGLNATKNNAFFKASIYVLDSGAVSFSEGDAKGLDRLRERILSYLLHEKSEARGPEAKASRYALQVMKKLGPLDPASLATLKGLKHDRLSDLQAELLSELALGDAALPDFARRHFDRALGKHDAGTLGALTLLGTARDRVYLKKKANELAASYREFPAELRPEALKRVLRMRDLIDLDLKPIVKSVDPSRPEWTEVFLLAVRDLDLAKEYREKLRTVERTAPSQHLREEAGRMLNERPRVSGRENGQ